MGQKTQLDIVNIIKKILSQNYKDLLTNQILKTLIIYKKHIVLGLFKLLYTSYSWYFINQEKTLLQNFIDLQEKISPL